MDPDANLAEQLRIVQRVNDGKADTDDAYRLADLVEALHEWIAGGGFLPKAWKK